MPSAEVTIKRPADSAESVTKKPADTAPAVPVRAPEGTETVVRQP